MDTAESRPARTPAAPGRRGARCAVAGLATATLLSPVLPLWPAAAVPEGWSNPSDVSAGSFLLVLIAVPIGLALLIALLVYVPALVRGEKITPGPEHVEDQWFGGPRQGTRELAAPDDETSQAGGASARW